MSDTKVLTPEESAELRRSTTIVVAYDRKPLLAAATEWRIALLSWSEFACETLEDEDSWSEALGAVQAAYKKIEDERIKQTGPLDKEVKALNKEFREYQLPLTEFKALASKTLSAARARRDEAERQAKLLVAAAADEGDEDATFEALAAVPEKAKVSGTRTTYVWEHEIIDESKIPASVKTFDEKRANMFLSLNGEGTQIPGVVSRRVAKVSTNGRSK